MGWVLTGIVLVASAVQILRVMRQRRGYGGQKKLRDEEIDRLLAGGTVERDEPLDLEEIAEEEERFFGETWDEPGPL